MGGEESSPVLTILLTILLVLNTFDYLTTKYATQIGIVELNPVMRELLITGCFGQVKLLIASILLSALILFTYSFETVLLKQSKINRLYRILVYVQGAVVGFYLGIVSNNLFQIFLVSR